MTYATRQLTEALQELTNQSARFEAKAGDSSGQPRNVEARELQLSEEVEAYLEKKRRYAERTRDVNEGCY